MAVLKLKHIEQWPDRHGKTRYYYRVGKGARIALKGKPGTDQFVKSYQLASCNYAKEPASEAGTFNALAKQFYVTSIKFKNTKQSTKVQTRRVLDLFLKEHGHRLVAQMKRQHVESMVAEKADTPGGANVFLQKLKLLIRFAIRNDWINRDPTLEVESFKIGTHHTWTEKQLKQFEQTWGFETLERMAFDLYLYTGQRGSDVCKMLWSDIKDGRKIAVEQLKGGKKLIIPMHTDLIAALENWPCSSNTILSQRGRNKGKPLKAARLSVLMARAIDKAKLPDECVAHGLRKAAARRLAEAGCTSHQIAAVTGHSTLREVERYTIAANQEQLAGQAMDRIDQARINRRNEEERAGLGKVKISQD